MAAAHLTRAATHAESAAIPVRAGLGLRFPHQQTILDTLPKIAWLEVHAENYMGDGPAVRSLEALRAHYPISVHAVGLSLGSVRAPDPDHLKRLRALLRRIEPGLVSDHLSWNVAAGIHLPDLFPLPLTEEALQVFSRHVDLAQEALGRQILIENPSSYLRYRHSTIPEPEFLARLAQMTGCGILCDVNNIFVSCVNHGWDAARYLDALPAEHVLELHLAGHAVRELPGGTLLVDDHGGPVAQSVWSLYRQAVARFGRKPVLIERDNNIPALHQLLREVAIADSIADDVEAAHELAAR